MRHLHSLAFLVILLKASVKSIELVPREGQDCALLSNKIYCYGGYMVGDPKDDVLNSLDIYKNNGGLSQNLNSQWEVVTPAPTNLVIGRRGFPQAVAAPDGERLLIQGGYNYDGVGKPIAQQTIVYNSKTNSWETYANYNDIKNGGDRQIYYGSGEYIPSLDGFGFYGGYQLHVTPNSNFATLNNVFVGLTFNNSDDYISSYAGFYYFTLFNMRTNTWTIPPQTNVPTDYHLSFSATYHPGTKKVFYIGGSYYNTTSKSIYSSYLSYATTFNTANGEWLQETIDGDYPSQREQHTTTLLANGDDILLYGGTLLEEVAVMDYCYTLNVPTMTWKYHNLAAPAGVSGPRSHHSAVLVNNTSLFIIFGLDKDGKRSNQLSVLDVRDANNITFASTFPFDNPNVTTNVDNGASAKHKKGLSTGAIAGIAVGGAIVGALAVLGLVYYSRSKNNKQAGSTTHYEEQKNNESELLEVDWDKIDNHYREMDLPPATIPPTINQQQQQHIQQQHQQQQAYYSQQQYMSDDLYSQAGSSTVMSASQPPHTSTTTSPETRFTGVSPNLYESKPNASEPTSPDIVKPSFMMKPVKPDGGF